MTLGQRIFQIRTEHNLSQEEFATKLGTTRQTVSRWELDQTYPEIAKIVMISKIFSVTTDSILRDGISTFDADYEQFVCGVYRGYNCEIVETERFALIYDCSADKAVLQTRLYKGYENKKKLVAACRWDELTQKTEYAYLIDGSEPHVAFTNSEKLVQMLTTPYDAQQKMSMRRMESFSVDHSGKTLPTVKEVGIPNCLQSWRMGDAYRTSPDEFRFYLCTGKTEYIFSIGFKDENIYCGASYNMVFDLGIFGGRQYFRIRNYKDNTDDFCQFHCDFTAQFEELSIPTDQCELGKCIDTANGMMWCVKRYSNDEIVLQGCGDDEYIYRRNDHRTERFIV